MAGDTVLRLVGVVLILSNSRAEQTSSCIVKTNREQSTPSVVVHCKGLNLTSVPKLLFTEKVVDLDLSMNQLQVSIALMTLTGFLLSYSFDWVLIIT